MWYAGYMVVFLWGQRLRYVDHEPPHETIAACQVRIEEMKPQVFEYVAHLSSEIHFYCFRRTYEHSARAD